jgi:uroporphyrinogen III methyltransferase/synthase
MTELHPARPGTVYIAGWGPGSGELATARTRGLVAEADLLLASRDLLKTARVLCKSAVVTQDLDAAGMDVAMAEAVAAGKVVVVLMQGDPVADGAGVDLLRTLQAAKTPAELVPGVPLAALTVAEVREARSRRPLQGRRIVVTRPREQAGEMVAWLSEAGAEAVLFPTILIEPVRDMVPMDHAMDHLGEHAWVIFTSANGVRCFMDRLAERGLDLRAFAGARVAAIGSATGDALARRGLRVDLIPQRYQAEGLLEALDEDLTGQRILIPRAREARDILPETLRRRGAQVEVLVVYQAVPQDQETASLRLQMTDGHIHAVTFTSSSTVTRFVELFRAGEAATLLRRHNIAVGCIGPITAKTAQDLDLPVEIQALTFTIPGLVAAMSRFFSPS